MAGKTKTTAANFLRAWRVWVGEHRGQDLTQTELAERMDTKASVVSELESGKMQLGQKWLDKLGRALGIPPGYLLFDPYSANMDVLRAAMEVEPDQRDHAIEVLRTFRHRA